MVQVDVFIFSIFTLLTLLEFSFQPLAVTVDSLLRVGSSSSKQQMGDSELLWYGKAVWSVEHSLSHSLVASDIKSFLPLLLWRGYFPELLIGFTLATGNLPGSYKEEREKWLARLIVCFCYLLRRQKVGTCYKPFLLFD